MKNYQLETDRIIASIPEGERPALLLHSCCGPCSAYVLEYLTAHFRVTLLYYDPNIQPHQEYQKRLDTQIQLLTHFPAVELLPCDYDGQAYEAAVRGLEGEREGGARCTVCFALRLEETARRAKELGFEYFCTTLSVSPHKDAERINAIGGAMGEKYGVSWLSSDFKKREGFKRSNRLAGEYGLYRQNYCGCLYSRPRGE